MHSENFSKCKIFQNDLTYDCRDTYAKIPELTLIMIFVFFDRREKISKFGLDKYGFMGSYSMFGFLYKHSILRIGHILHCRHGTKVMEKANEE